MSLGTYIVFIIAYDLTSAQNIEIIGLRLYYDQMYNIILFIQRVDQCVLAHCLLITFKITLYL